MVSTKGGAALDCRASSARRRSLKKRSTRTAMNATRRTRMKTMAAFLTRRPVSGSKRVELPQSSLPAPSSPRAVARVASFACMSASCELGSGSGWSIELPFRNNGTPPQHAIHHRYEDQGGKSREQQATDNGARQRRVLLTALTYTERHRYHAEDHRAG